MFDGFFILNIFAQSFKFFPVFDDLFDEGIWIIRIPKNFYPILRTELRSWRDKVGDWRHKSCRSTKFWRYWNLNAKLIEWFFLLNTMTTFDQFNNLTTFLFHHSDLFHGFFINMDIEFKVFHFKVVVRKFFFLQWIIHNKLSSWFLTLEVDSSNVRLVVLNWKHKNLNDIWINWPHHFYEFIFKLFYWQVLWFLQTSCKQRNIGVNLPIMKVNHHLGFVFF